MENYSVLMSLYYKEKPEYLVQALESMINQTMRPDEIVMVYDGKLTDELYKVMEDYIKNYPGLFNIVINEENLGLGLSLKRGLLICKNELIARMDTDDISRLDRCKLEIQFLNKNPEISIVGSQIDEFTGVKTNIISTRKVPINDLDIKRYMKKRCPFNHVTVMFKKKDIIESGNYRDFFWNEDYDLWIRMAIEGKHFSNIDESLVKVRIDNQTFNRRGGLRYFKSEFKIQTYMLKNKVIGNMIFISNILKRFVVQIILPIKVRGFVFKKFARSSVL